MLMITRTANVLELANGDQRRLVLDVTDVAGAMLCAERAPCGRVAQVLALSFGAGRMPLRIEGSAYELKELHQLVTEIMLETVPGSLH